MAHIDIALRIMQTYQNGLQMMKKNIILKNHPLQKYNFNKKKKG